MVAQRLLQGLTGLFIISLVVTVADYLLRLPPLVRLVVGVLILLLGGTWLITRLAEAWRFGPRLTDLALRAEVLFPQLAGRFASAVDFAMGSSSNPLAQVSMHQVREQLDNISLNRLINPTQTLRHLSFAAGLGLAVFILVLVWPQSSYLALNRWLAPYGSTQWPHRTDMRTLVQTQVWPTDTPLPLQAVVVRGGSSDMRVWLRYRWIDASGKTLGAKSQGWQSVLMSPQGATQNQQWRFERLITPSPHSALAGVSETSGTGVEFYFQGGDDQTATQQIRLVERPALKTLTLTTQPPAYAMGSISPQTLHWDMATLSPGQRVSTDVLMGSQVTWTLTLNKPLVHLAMDASAVLETLLPGLTDEKKVQLEMTADHRLVARWTLTQTIGTTVNLTDAFGLTNLSDRIYRIEAVKDSLPTVNLRQPMADQSVLPQAVVALEAVGRDDIAMSTLALEAKVDESKDSVRLAEQHDRAEQIKVSAALDLSRWPSLKAGQVVALWAVGRDGFDLAGESHQPVRSAVRLLHIIDEATLTSRIRSELSAIRQQVIRLQSRQQTLINAPAVAARVGQKRVTEQLIHQRQATASLHQQMRANKLDQPALERLVQRADGLLDQARKTSDEAVKRLGQPQRRHAAISQEKVNEHLLALISLLDQGQDALTLQLQIQDLLKQQQAMRQQARALLPRTLGQTPQQLSKDVRKELESLADHQKALADKASQLLDQLRQASEQLSQQKEAESQAAAEALDQASHVAQRQGLEQSMRQAAEAASQNHLTEASDQQRQSEATLALMLSQMAQQDQKRQAILRRQIMALAKTLEALIRQQQVQLDRLGKAKSLSPLIPSLAQLRRNTMVAQDDASAAQAVKVVVENLRLAVDQQGSALTQLRQSQSTVVALHEAKALSHLKTALEEIKKEQQKEEDAQARKEQQKLKQAYEKLAQTQDQIYQDTGPFEAMVKPDRRARRDLRKLGVRQAELRMEVSTLEQKVQKTLLFRHLHQRVDATAKQITTDLRQGLANGDVRHRQQSITRLLRQMANALEAQAEAERFADATQAPQSGAGGSGSGGGSGVPPIAELRLLRSLQLEVYEQTRHLPKKASEQQLQALALEQRELASLGEQLIEQYAKQHTPSVKEAKP